MQCSKLKRIRPRGIRLLILSALLVNLQSGMRAQAPQARGASGRAGPDGPVVVSPEVRDREGTQIVAQLVQNALWDETGPHKISHNSVRSLEESRCQLFM